MNIFGNIINFVVAVGFGSILVGLFCVAVTFGLLLIGMSKELIQGIIEEFFM